MHVSLLGQDSGGCNFRGVVRPRPDVVEEFAVSFSLDDLALALA